MSEYGRICKDMPEYARICLNVLECGNAVECPTGQGFGARLRDLESGI